MCKDWIQSALYCYVFYCSLLFTLYLEDFDHGLFDDYKHLVHVYPRRWTLSLKAWINNDNIQICITYNWLIHFCCHIDPFGDLVINDKIEFMWQNGILYLLSSLKIKKSNGSLIWKPCLDFDDSQGIVSGFDQWVSYALTLVCQEVISRFDLWVSRALSYSRLFQGWICEQVMLWLWSCSPEFIYKIWRFEFRW